MNLFERLPQEDVNLLWQYLDDFSDGSALSRTQMDYFLRFWNTAKEPFYRAFGEEFILKREIAFDKPVDDLEDEMESAIWWGDRVIRDFCNEYRARLNELMPGYEYCEMRETLQNFALNWAMLVENIYDGDSITIPGSMTVNKRPLQINKGCKVVKMLGKIVEALDCAEGYEAFRRAHSLVLNQKRIRGNLCLSIHPLDYLTMSDNECGWNSCMSWMEDYGDYRLGTIEMMNSPVVVIAYVEAREPMSVCGSEWNNKRWRQLYIVSDKLILGNRQYPYDNEVIQGYAIKWLRELVSALPGYGPYAEEASAIRGRGEWNTIAGDKSVRFNLYCDYMYNDIYDRRLAYVADTKFEDGEHYDLDFSGLAVCTGCGDIIELETVEAHRVQCRRCDGSWRCDHCGDWHSEYDESYCVGESVYCDWCYHNELEECEVCGERHEPSDLRHIYLQVLDTDNEEIRDGFNFNYYVSICDWCWEHEQEESEKLFGVPHKVKDSWGNDRYAFDIKAVTDEGFCHGDLTNDSINLIKRMRDCKSDEERLTLLRQYSY